MSAKALVCHPSGGKNRLAREDVEIPALKPRDILVRVLAVAQNPTDIKSFDQNRFGDGAILGCDFCGRVEDVGKEVARFQRGDRMSGFVRGGRPGGLGAYATHTIADDGLGFVVPEGMSSEAAATLPLALATASLALLSPHSIGMDRSKSNKNQLLIWGGSSSVGQYAIQIAKHFGFQFATTCKNTKVVEALGAKHIFDYSSPTVIEDVKRVMPNLTYVLDCIGSETSSAQASHAVCESGGALCTIQPGRAYTENVVARVEVSDVMVFTCFFEEIKTPRFTVPKRAEDRDLCHELFRILPDLISNGSIKPNPVRVIEGGLGGVDHGFELYRAGAVSGQKLVYKLES
ncbi:hypothetical protein LTR46_003327 [Exophiala xenobiotica]|nr:hypothetical protein LTR18_004836 [Exophiala xenobiotica]KAK5559138.1 hypothetical protein LTR46_003327 [Exophiala xenobiotica]